METILFQTMEYQSDGTFQQIGYKYEGKEESGWKIYRNGNSFMELGPGYVLLKPKYCGICATDIDRKFLPYPLPQIIGHEVVGEYNNINVVVEINASHQARGIQNESCPFCRNGLETHCPKRITLGIDRLPGGFSPFLLAPKNSLIKIPVTLSPVVASITEPLAAALQALKVSTPENGDCVSVLGIGRLGLLLISALYGHRRKNGLNFKISAVGRRQHLSTLSCQMGADEFLLLNDDSQRQLEDSFDIVFDTSGSPLGFESALNLSRRVVHLKSTNGQEVMGMTQLTDMVVDEIALLPFSYDKLNFQWKSEKTRWKNTNVFISPGVSKSEMEKLVQASPQINFVQENEEIAFRQLRQPETILKNYALPLFDMAIVSCLAEADRIIRPVKGENLSLLKPRGAILLLNTGNGKPNLLEESIVKKGVKIHSSRCGEFKEALEILDQNPELCQIIEEKYITHRFPLKQITEAFKIAADSSESIKVMIEI
ncbi:alcohol dehydrogenase catalytic domain-containing protein [bacterium]|nr:alcohol dehydrogenase catalytic domain-containing protein [bacterium]